MKPAILTFYLFGLILSLSAAEPLRLAVPGKVIYANTFDVVPDVPWQKMKGAWTLVDGAWRGATKPDDKHGAVILLSQKLPDFVIEYEFRFAGGKSTSLYLRTPTAHMGRITITPQYVSLQRDASNDGVIKPEVFARLTVHLWYRYMA